MRLSRHRSRLQRVEQSVLALPVRRAVVDEALDQFRATGELPAQERIARAVIQRAREVRVETVDLETGIGALAKLLRQIEAGEPLPTPRPGECLFLHAAEDGPPVPETSVLIAEAKGYVELAAELGLVTPGDLA